MTKQLFLLIWCAVLSMSTLSYAESEYDDPDSLDEALAQLVPAAPEGAVSWHDLGTTEILFNDEDGVVYPKFSEYVLGLDGTDIEIVGFMFPIETTEKHTHFYLAALPPSCAFCLPAGPNYMMDVKTDKPFDFTYDPIHVTGTFHLSDNYPELPVFYTLTGVQLKK